MRSAPFLSAQCPHTINKIARPFAASIHSTRFEVDFIIHSFTVLRSPCTCFAAAWSRAFAVLLFPVLRSPCTCFAAAWSRAFAVLLFPVLRSPCTCFAAAWSRAFVECPPAHKKTAACKQACSGCPLCAVSAELIAFAQIIQQWKQHVRIQRYGHPHE